MILFSSTRNSESDAVMKKSRKCTVLTNGNTAILSDYIIRTAP